MMDNYDDSVGVDLNNVHYADLSEDEYIGDENVNDVVSSGHQSSNDEDNVNNEDDEESVGAEWLNSQTIIGDRLVSINSITSDEISAMEFGNVSEAYEFYYRYEKCKGFSIRKSNVRQRGSEGSEIIVMRKFVYNKHELGEKKHFSRVDRKRDR
ncbi:uncharacterized protein LOC127097173 isoform X2 [Lathyrus oleraceus]|uniref:uncharacterized protein LOC127097173 isoform X2 n=1 Tax=Pisum sativum TaxID=3888 RepID=UPI0021D2320D|nr:uncharacterized protein LOC127097173 isoform X2 [Pisum sativum]